MALLSGFRGVSWRRGLVSLGSLPILAGLAVAVPSGLGPLTPPPVDQPLHFSHKRHLAADVLGGDCIVCHDRLFDSASAGQPATDLCLGCHMAMEPQTEDARRLLAYADLGEPIPWQRVWRLPTHAFYSHRTHVAVAGIDCAVCHGDIAGTDEPLRQPLMTLTMQDCMDCHAAWPDHPAAPAAAKVTPVAVSNDCNACHR